MAARNLTASFCEAVQPVPGKQIAYADAVVRGLEFRVAEGRKAWCFRYRALDGRQRRLTLGTFSAALNVKEARVQATKARAIVDTGGDPAGEKRRQKYAAKAQPIKTFDDLAQAYFKACEEGTYTPRGKVKRARSLADETGVYRRHVKVVLGAENVEAVTRSRTNAFLKTMIAKGIGAQTNRAQAMIRAALSYAVAEERLQFNPLLGMARAAVTHPRERTLEDNELKPLWWALKRSASLMDAEGHKVHIGPAMALALRLAILLPNRRKEIAGMALAELNLDQRTWKIPGDRMKGSKGHLVTLGPMSVALIEEAIALNEGVETPYVFRSSHNPLKPFHPDSVTHAMARVTRALGIKNATPHDLRRTGGSALTSERIGASPFIRSKVLGHADTGGGAAVSMIHYDVNTYVSEKRQALTAWETLVLKIVGDHAGGARNAA
jgi:integrase